MTIIAFYTTCESHEGEKILINIPDSTYAVNLWQIAKQCECRFPQGRLVRIEIVMTLMEGAK